MSQLCGKLRPRSLNRSDLDSLVVHVPERIIRAVMTKEEHAFFLSMFSRVYEVVGVLEETLKSRGLWSEDDQKAFATVVHSDDERLLYYAQRAHNDYKALAKAAGLITDVEP